LSKGDIVAESNDIYSAICQIYDSCLPALQSWCADRGLALLELETIRQPDMPDGSIAFLWLFAELEFRDRLGNGQMAKVVVAPWRFLENQEDMEKASFMVFSTFGFGNPEFEQDFAPFIFTDSRPTNFISFLRTAKQLEVGKDVFCVTPDGMV
jgi:hypothetical protein